MITIVSDTEPALGKATAIAASLKRSQIIQAYELSPTITGLDLTLHPATADIVQEKGGYDSYEKEILEKFAVAGFKLFEAEPVAPVEVLPAPESETPLVPVVDEESKNE